MYKTRDVITGAFGVPGEDENSRIMVEFCTERGMCVGMYSNHRSSHKYTRVARCKMEWR